MLPLAPRIGARRPTLPEFVARWRGPLAWLVVPAVALAVDRQPEHLQLGIQILLGGAIAIASWRRPDIGILGLVVGLPFQLVALAFLYAHGAPVWVVRPLGLWKEAVVLGIVLAAVRAWRAAGHPPDAIDWAAGAYLTVVGMYYVAPGAFVAADGTFAGPPTGRATLDVALRTEALFVVLLVAVRHLDLGSGCRDRFARVVLAVGVAVATIGVVELAFSAQWNHLVVTTLQVPRYKLEILGVPTRSNDVRVYGQIGGTQVVRIGSVFLDPLQCALWLVAPLAVGLQRLLRGGRAVMAASMAIIGLAIVGTQTRAALLAVAIASVCVLRPHVGVDRVARARGAALLGLALLALLPVALASGLVQRTIGGAEGDNGSTQVHLQRSKAALRTFIDRPFGRGLGTGPGTATRFGVQTRLLSEDYYLQVANETGVASVAMFLILVGVANRRLGASRNDGELLGAAWRGLFLGLSVAALLLHVWENLAVAWTAWIGVGLVLRPGPAPCRQRRRISS